MNFCLCYNRGVSRLQLLKKKRQNILDLAQKRGGHNVRVFGSVVRGDDTGESDVDFLVTFHVGTTLFDRSGLIVDLREYLGCDVDVVSDKSIHPLIQDEVIHSAVPL